MRISGDNGVQDCKSSRTSGLPSFRLATVSKPAASKIAVDPMQSVTDFDCFT
jgi:hypothetical protein